MIRPAILRRSDGRVPSRRGVAMLWTLVTVPAFMLMLLIVIDVGNMWVSRAELENAMEAEAAAAALSWGTSGTPEGTGWTATPRARGVAVGQANHVRGGTLALAANQGMYNAATNPNENSDSSAAGPLVFGRLVEGAPSTFDPGTAPGAGQFGVRARKSATVNSLVVSFVGIAFSPYTITCEAYALYDGTRVRLVTVP